MQRRFFSILFKQLKPTDESNPLSNQFKEHQIKQKFDSIYARLGQNDIKEAEKIFHQLCWSKSQDLLAHPDYQIHLINQFIEQHLDSERFSNGFRVKRKSGYDKALTWLKMIPNLPSNKMVQIKPNAKTYGLMIAYQLERGKADDAKELLKQMNSQNIPTSDLFLLDTFYDKGLEYMLKSLIDDTTQSPLSSFVQTSFRESKELKSVDSSTVNILQELMSEVKKFPEKDLYNRQVWLEMASLKAGRLMLEKDEHSPSQQLLSIWTEQLIDYLKDSLQPKEVEHLLHGLSTKRLAEITVQAVHSAFVKTFENVVAIELCSKIGEDVNQYKRSKKMGRLSDLSNTLNTNWDHFDHQLRSEMAELVRKNEQLNSEESSWGSNSKVIVGDFLLKCLIEACKISGNETIYPIRHELKHYGEKVVGVIIIDEKFQEGLRKSNTLQLWHVPMLTTPRPWLTLKSGGYHSLNTSFVRTHDDQHWEILKRADEAGRLKIVQLALDILGSTAWRINNEVFEIAAYFWNSNIEVPYLPVVPESKIIKGPNMSKDEFRQWYKERKAILELTSQRCDANYKMEIAKSVCVFNYSF